MSIKGVVTLALPGQSSVSMNRLAPHVGSVGRCQEGLCARHFFRLGKPEEVAL
ncbi:hypothetical protein [Reticulibacter mediterranei]|uniref:hypothetical protein n=1 Tax=Reticulibacter mediterranei TaxID=2778369 RepID=UPI001C6941E9|nr:hypothetical protein [Reticulibacter mediterranei]